MTAWLDHQRVRVHAPQLGDTTTELRSRHTNGDRAAPTAGRRWISVGPGDYICVYCHRLRHLSFPATKCCCPIRRTNKRDSSIRLYPCDDTESTVRRTRGQKAVDSILWPHSYLRWTFTPPEIICWIVGFARCFMREAHCDRLMSSSRLM